MLDNVFGIIFLVENPNLRPCAYNLDLYGKTLHHWIKAALGSIRHAELNIDYNTDAQRVIALAKEAVDPTSEYTVILYSDTPLITKKTIGDALSELIGSGEKMLRLSRGFVVRTDYLLSCTFPFDFRHYYVDEEDFLTVSSFKNFAMVGDVLRNRILEHHMKNGVLIYDTATVYIDAEVSIESGVTIFPDNVLKGKTAISKGVVLNKGNIISDSIIGEGAKILQSNINFSLIGENTTVGPFAYLRPNSKVGKGCRIGDFVEIKNSTIGDGTKLSHLAYCGDCETGKNCNIGCGAIIVNYDGKSKSRTKLGDNVFVGSNCNLIAPITLEDNCFVAAGSTLTDDVPKDALAIARARQVLKPQWNKLRQQK